MRKSIDNRSPIPCGLGGSGYFASLNTPSRPRYCPKGNTRGFWAPAMRAASLCAASRAYAFAAALCISGRALRAYARLLSRFAANRQRIIAAIARIISRFETI